MKSSSLFDFFCFFQFLSFVGFIFFFVGFTMHLMDSQTVTTNGGSTAYSTVPYIVHCRVHGKETFTEPCLVDLLNVGLIIVPFHFS